MRKCLITSKTHSWQFSVGLHPLLVLSEFASCLECEGRVVRHPSSPAPWSSGEREVSLKLSWICPASFLHSCPPSQFCRDSPRFLSLSRISRPVSTVPREFPGIVRSPCKLLTQTHITYVPILSATATKNCKSSFAFRQSSKKCLCC